MAAMSTGEEALELFEREDYTCDLLVSNVVLPGMNGRELYERLETKRPGLPALFVSGYSHDVLATTGLPSGAQLLMKPFRTGDITAKIREVLGDRESATPPPPGTTPPAHRQDRAAIDSDSPTVV